MIAEIQMPFRISGPRQQRLFVAIALVCALCVGLAGCASWQLPAEFDESVLRVRAESETVNGVTLSAAVLSSADSKRMFGIDVNASGVQPVWVEIENTTNQVLWLLRFGTDPDLFSPLEVAWSFHKSFASETNASIDLHFDGLSFQNPVAPKSTRSGILFTNPHRKTRLLSVDVLGHGQLFPFTLFPVVPNDQTVESEVLDRLWVLIESADEEYKNADALRAALAQLPCCAMDAEGMNTGDPINVILVGKFEDIATALVRRGFRQDETGVDRVQHLFGRPPDVVARKTGQAGVPANWLRIWVSPLRYQEQSVILVQAGRPLGWRYSVREADSLQLSPNVDEVRDLLIQDLLYSGGLEKIAYVTGVGKTERGDVRVSLDGVEYHTDGLRAVLFLTTRPKSLSDVEVLDWYPALKLREQEAASRQDNSEH